MINLILCVNNKPEYNKYQWVLKNNRLCQKKDMDFHGSQPWKEFKFLKANFYEKKLYITVLVYFYNALHENIVEKQMQFRGNSQMDNLKLYYKYKLPQHIAQFIKCIRVILDIVKLIFFLKIII